MNGLLKLGLFFKSLTLVLRINVSERLLIQVLNQQCRRRLLYGLLVSEYAVSCQIVAKLCIYNFC